MKSVHQWLKEVDPIGREEPLSGDEIQKIRRRVVGAVDDRRASGFNVSRLPVAIAAAALIASVAAPLTHLWKSTEVRSTVQSLPAPERPADTRQLQFATPGGTRVIWVFNSEFEP